MSLQYEIYLPTKKSNGDPIDSVTLKEIRSSLIEKFGGLTDTRVKTDGFWKSGGVTILDEILIWKVLSDEGKAGDSFLGEIKKGLERLLDQDKILIVKQSVETL
ncbi:MAG: hypothetical protein EOP04_28005 [Proteobacteria bacterium]|nr:MAG: hypothetical protein EOP04_28005 [Pseudomonadota bacterium]